MNTLRLVALLLSASLLCACETDAGMQVASIVSSGFAASNCREKFDPVQREQCFKRADNTYNEAKELRKDPSRKDIPLP